MTSSSLTRAGERRVHDRLHLHRLEHDDGGTGLDLGADGCRGGDDERRRGRAQHAALVAADPVGDAVDLDERGRPVGGGDQVVGPAADDQAPAYVVDRAPSRTSTVCSVAPEATLTRKRPGPVLTVETW